MNESSPTPGSQAWLDLVVEPIIDPGREIIDPHHHLWPAGGALPYGPDELAGDTTSGHNVVATMFMECHAAYHSEGPPHLRSVGETEFVANSADLLATEHPGSPPITGIVAGADLTLGAQLDEVLDAHEAAAGGRFRGIRDALARATEPDVMMIAGANAAGKYADPNFRAGVRRLGERGLTYDSWHYHHQNREMLELARAVPDTLMVLDHFGTPVGVGSCASRREEIFEMWQRDIADLATCDNVVAKIGGLAMPDNGFGWHEAARPPTSDDFVAQQSRYYLHTIESFGPQRCMFESNFPVDRFSISYPVLWNALKKIAAEFSDTEQDAMFSGTARRVYRLP
jgi:predicted TIM-barrel fold metal-dependent hydrolase